MHVRSFQDCWLSCAITHALWRGKKFLDPHDRRGVQPPAMQQRSIAIILIGQSPGRRMKRLRRMTGQWRQCGATVEQVFAYI